MKYSRRTSNYLERISNLPHIMNIIGLMAICVEAPMIYNGNIISNILGEFIELIHTDP